MRNILAFMGFLCTMPIAAKAQSVMVPHQSALFKSTETLPTPPRPVSDSITTNDRVVSAIVWGAILGGVGMLIVGDGDASDNGRSTQRKIIISMALAGAVAGFVTGGRPAKD